MTISPAAALRHTRSWRAAAGPRAFGREAGLASLTAFAYFLIRGAVVDRAAEAHARAEALYDLERSLGLDWEPAMQGWILGSRFLIDLFNGIYFWTHMPLIVAVGLALYWKRRPVYFLIRNAFLVSAVGALILYLSLPLAPPRFFPELGFVDTMARYAEANYQAQEVGPFVNAYAAMPSLHFGWALLIGIALWLARPQGRVWAALAAVAAAVLVLGQLFAVVMTGNHWLLDAVAGAAVALIGLALAHGWRVRRWRDRAQPADADLPVIRERTPHAQVDR